MQYMISWNERTHGSAEEYENAQKRILGTFRHWEPPAGLTIKAFVVGIGDYGGYMLAEADEPGILHKMTSTFPAFRFKIEVVLDIQEAVGLELEAIAWRDSVAE